MTQSQEKHEMWATTSQAELGQIRALMNLSGTVSFCGKKGAGFYQLTVLSAD